MKFRETVNQLIDLDRQRQELLGPSLQTADDSSPESVLREMESAIQEGRAANNAAIQTWPERIG